MIRRTCRLGALALATGAVLAAGMTPAVAAPEDGVAPAPRRRISPVHDLLVEQLRRQ